MTRYAVAARTCSFLLALAICCLLPAHVRSASSTVAQPDTPVAITDDLGRQVTLKQPAQRIIALYGAFNETLAAMGKTHLLVARTHADTVPAAITVLPSIGTHMRPNTELVAGLRPDLVLQMGGRKKALETTRALEQLGIPVAFFTATTFDHLFSMIKRLGVLTGDSEAAHSLIARLTKRLDSVAKTLGPLAPHGTAASPSFRHRPAVFFEVRYPNLLGAGTHSIVGDIITRAGGYNILDASYGNKKLIRLNEEELIRQNPDVYLVQKGPMNPAPVPLAQRPHFQLLKAVQEGRTATVDQFIYSRPGPRAVDAVEALARMLHPDVFTVPPTNNSLTQATQ